MIIPTAWGNRAPAAALALLVMAMAPTTRVLAQETIAADRPGIGSGSFVLGAGTIQVEGGLSRSQAGNVREYRAGQLLLRAGVGRFELQGIFNSLVVRRSPGLDDEGFEDIGIGVKAPLVRSPDAGVSLSVLAAISVPTGSPTNSNDEAVAFGAVLLDYSVADRVGLAVNLGHSAGLGAGQGDGVFSLVVTPAVSLTPRVGAFLGYAGFYSTGRDRHFAEGGLTLLGSPDLQLDLNGGVDVDSGDYFVGFGLAARLR